MGEISVTIFLAEVDELMAVSHGHAYHPHYKLSYLACIQMKEKYHKLSEEYKLQVRARAGDITVKSLWSQTLG